MFCTVFFIGFKIWGQIKAKLLTVLPNGLGCLFARHCQQACFTGPKSWILSCEKAHLSFKVCFGTVSLGENIKAGVHVFFLLLMSLYKTNPQNTEAVEILVKRRSPLSQHFESPSGAKHQYLWAAEHSH